MSKKGNNSYWNYRIVKQEYEYKEGSETTYTIHEVHYRNGKIWAITSEPTSFMADSIEELNNVIHMMHQAFLKPCIDYYSKKEIKE